jgi:DNA gyrase subunit A
MNPVQTVSLHEAASQRYLAYALSVITARALPDVRDGLKPVQRRILYTMYQEMGLRSGGRYRKCAAVVGEVMGKFHPHGDQSIYDALVRMAQDFSLRLPLIDGQGNFGSLDGDPPAAMRYTECKLRPLAEELNRELKKRTVDFRPSYDGQRFEPVVLPAQLPHLLINGSEGIAVGMATRIPPHNPAEIIDAAVALINDRDQTVEDLLAFVQGPDFPTGGRLLASPDQLLKIYETGNGSVKIRAEYELEKVARRHQLVLTSVPYGQNKSKLIQGIGDLVRTRKLPQVVDVRDESTDDVRVVLELKQGANHEAVMAYLYKRTNLECTWPINMNALVPGSGPVARPAKLDLRMALLHWLDFRFETVRRRFEFDLKQLLERIHLLEGLAILFGFLDEAIRLIRESEGRRDAHEKLIERFKLSDLQTDAILDLKLYKLAKLEIAAILEELAEKRAEAERIEGVLSSDAEIWSHVRGELLELRGLVNSPRRTIVGFPEKQLAYNEDLYIVKEDTWVVVTRDGWIKRQSSFSSIDKIRVRDGDGIGWLMLAGTRTTVTLLSSAGGAYVMRVGDVPATTGYGEPVQRYFGFADGERVVGVISHDERHLPELVSDPDEETQPFHTLVAVTQRGRVLRMPLSAHREPSTKSGRRYARLGDGDQVFAAYPCGGHESVCVATHGGRAMTFPSSEAPILRSQGKGVAGIRLRDDDQIMAFELSTQPGDGPTVVTAKGRTLVVRPRVFAGRRGGRGKVVLQRGTIETWVRTPEVFAVTTDEEE